MTRVLVDTNVILDVLLDRRPHVEASAAVWAAIETGAAEGLVAAHAVTTIYYLMQKALGTARAKRSMTAILSVFIVAPVDGSVIGEALRSPLTDFEDAVTAAAAARAACDYIVTRDPKGFRGASVPQLTPAEAVPLLATM